ncbi:hypothetical protein LZ30DRAFT_690204 [Colletotrichum cereale]|nr:hypothetical protein LZ30DRAFT_690204 [Colletotrichum cereale]
MSDESRPLSLLLLLLLAGSTEDDGGTGTRDGVGEGVSAAASDVDSAAGTEVGEGSGGGSDSDGVGLEEMMKVVSGRAELEGARVGGGCVGACEGVRDAVGVFCRAGAVDDAAAAAANDDDDDEAVVVTRCDVAAAPAVLGFPVPDPVCPPRPEPERASEEGVSQLFMFVVGDAGLDESPCEWGRFSANPSMKAEAGVSGGECPTVVSRWLM